MTMTLSERAHAVRTREDFVAFAAALVTDHESHLATWTNKDLASFLAAISSWSEDMDGYYENTGEALSTLSPWRVMADILMAARVYE